MMKMKAIIMILALAALASCKKEPIVKPCVPPQKIKRPEFPDVVKPDTIIVLIPKG